MRRAGCTRDTGTHDRGRQLHRSVQLQEGARYGTILNHFCGPTRASDIEITPRSHCKLGALQIEGVKEQLKAEATGAAYRGKTALTLAAAGAVVYIPGANKAAQTSGRFSHCSKKENKTK